MPQKTYKQIDDNTIEESYKKQRTEKVIHKIKDIKRQRDYHKEEYDKRVEILKIIKK